MSDRSDRQASGDAAGGNPSTPPDSAPHVIGDPTALRALAHPVRLALLDALLERSLSATEAGEQIGQSATTCSYHLRQLSRYGFVQETENGPGRRRVWSRVHDRWRVPASGYEEPLAAASQMAQETMVEYYFQRMRYAVSHLSSDSKEWQLAALGSVSTFFVTAAELAEFGRAYVEMNEFFVKRWGGRTKRPELRPPGHRRIEILTLAAPVAMEQKNVKSAE